MHPLPHPVRLVLPLLLLVGALGCTGGPECGDGVVEAPEACDTGLTTGPSACPTTCDDGYACTVDRLEGAACQARCVYERIEVCEGGDGCCPQGCDAVADPDCPSRCGNGVTEPGETCDGDDCPETCDDGNPCTADRGRGEVGRCSFECVHTEVTACRGGDGCCPEGCVRNTDGDCDPVCGNKVVEPPETCDAWCPPGCDDGDACTADVREGDPSTCDVACAHQPIEACESGDGCCPAGCTEAEDLDCAPCAPLACGSPGRACGLTDDGCGAALDCGPCPDGDVCLDGACVPPVTLGGPCEADGGCVGGACIEEAPDGWTGGYCSGTCTDDAGCGSGGHCGWLEGEAFGLCLRACASDGDCRADYGCRDADGDGRRECAPEGTGAGAVGAPCTAYADCAGGAEGFCATASRGFEDGYCSLTGCGEGAPCPAGAHCAFGDDPAAAACVADCTADAECRGGDGYLCLDADGDTTRECWPAATGAAPVGAACDQVWTCAGGADGACAQAPAWPEGYCTVACDATGGCPGGSTCAVLDPAAPDSTFCLDACAGTGECRPGYRCEPVARDAALVCVPGDLS